MPAPDRQLSTLSDFRPQTVYWLQASTLPARTPGSFWGAIAFRRRYLRFNPHAAPSRFLLLTRPGAGRSALGVRFTDATK